MGTSAVVKAMDGCGGTDAGECMDARLLDLLRTLNGSTGLYEDYDFPCRCTCELPCQTTLLPIV